MPKFSPVSHIIFDLDGLLLDTESIYREGIEKLMQKYGKVYSDELRMKVTGTKEQDTTRLLLEELKLPKTLEEFSNEFFSHFKDAFNRVQLKPGAEKLIRHFNAKKVLMALATSSGKEICEKKLAIHSELFSYLNHMVMGSSDSEVVNGKPAPDIFIVAARRFPDPPSPDKCLVFEDSYNGVLAARAANMQVVMVPESLVSEDKRKVPTVVLNSLEEFVPEDFGLPPFDS